MLGLLILVALMLWFVSERNGCSLPVIHTQHQHYHEPFLGTDKSPMISELSFNSNSRSNDYFYDKTGMKGTLFRTLPTEPKYEVPEKKEIILPEHRVVKYLEIYPEQFYAKCESKFKQSDLIEPSYNNDPLNVRLGFNQGVLF